MCQIYDLYKKNNKDNDEPIYLYVLLIHQRFLMIARSRHYVHVKI